MKFQLLPINHAMIVKHIYLSQTWVVEFSCV